MGEQARYGSIYVNAVREWVGILLVDVNQILRQLITGWSGWRTKQKPAGKSMIINKIM